MKRLFAVDALKGIAIISVVVLHGLSADQGLAMWEGFHISQAVPVFMLLMGFNAKRSLDRISISSLRGTYTSGYVGRRAKRLIGPALAAAIALVAIALGRGIAPYVGPYWLIFKFPVPFPGQFFVGVSVYLAFVTPLVYSAYLRAPRLTVVCCIGISLGFELVSATHGFLWPDRYFLYQVVPLRFIGLFGLGFWLADGASPLFARNRFIWPYAALSAAFLVAYSLGWRPWFVGPEYPYNIIAGGYPLLLTASGLTWLPDASPGRAFDLLGYLGVASYQIFLVQGIWYGQLAAALSLSGTLWLPVGLVTCLCVGAGWYALGARAGRR